MLATGLMAAASLTPAAANDTVRSPDDLKIATYNVMFFLPQSISNWGQRERADLIANDGVVSGQDVVVFQEGQDNGASNRLLDNLKTEYPSTTPWVGRSRSGWDATTGIWKAIGEDGGVAIASKWPIVRKGQHIFAQGCGPEAMASKGFAYAQISTDAGKIHVIGTHLQSQDSACATGEAERVRTTQIQEIRDFLRAKQFPAGEPVFIAGDLNIIGGTAEQATAFSLLGVDPRTSIDGPLSFDPSTNSIAAYRYPGTAAEQLDYVLPIGRSLNNAWSSRTVVVHSPEWSVRSWFQTYTYTDYSDHYPVMGSGS